VDKLRTLTFGMPGRDYRVFGLGEHWRLMVNNILDQDNFMRFTDAMRIARESYLLDILGERVFDAEEDIADYDNITAGTNGIIFRAAGKDNVMKMVALPSFDENNDIANLQAGDEGRDLYGEMALAVNYYQAQMMEALWKRQQEGKSIPKGLPILKDFRRGNVTPDMIESFRNNKQLQEKGFRTPEYDIELDELIMDIFPVGEPYAMWEMEYIPLTVENEWGGIGPNEEARWELPMWKLNRATNAEYKSFKEVANFLLDEYGLIVRDARNPGNVGYRELDGSVEPIFFDLIVAPVPGSPALQDYEGKESKLWNIIFGKGSAADHAYESYLQSVRHCYDKTGPRCRDGMTYADWRHQYSAFDKEVKKW